MISFFIFGLSNSVIINEAESENSDNEINEVSEEELLQEVEEYLNENNTSVVDELNNTVLKYENLSLNAS